MVIDTSAVVAIAFNEPEAETYEEKVVDAPRRFMSAATVLELAIVIGSARQAQQNSICGSIRRVSKSSLSTRNRSPWQGEPGAAMARVDIRRV